jgi:hypothetical protein
MEKSNSLIELGEEYDDLETEFLLKDCSTAEQLRRRRAMFQQFNEALSDDKSDETG